MSKYEKIAEMLKRRILNDDYVINRLPGARKLAKETGVSYMTARQALQKLETDKVIVLHENGRFVVNRRSLGHSRKLKIAYLAHQKQSVYNVWEQAVRMAARKRNMNFRCVYYSHNEDPLITEVLSGDFDLVFINHDTLLNNHDFVHKLVIKNRNKLVTMFHDLTASGVRCLDGPEPVSVSKLIDYLYESGHRRFASYYCKNLTQSLSEKIFYWERYLQKYQLHSQRFEFSPKYPNEYLIVPALREASMLFAGEEIPTAIFCPSLELAMGVLRYCHDNGIVPGRDVSVCSFGQPEMAATFIPSITIIDRPNPLPQVEAIIDDFIAGNNSRLIYRPDDGKLIIGESTGSVKK